MARLEALQVDLERGSKGLCLAIMGLGAGAELRLEKLGIFVKSVTPGGVAAKDGRVKEGDQIIEVNGQSLVGVTQTHAATVLRAALGTVSFLLGREKVVEQQQTNHQHEPVNIYNLTAALCYGQSNSVGLIELCGVKGELQQ